MFAIFMLLPCYFEMLHCCQQRVTTNKNNQTKGKLCVFSIYIIVDCIKVKFHRVSIQKYLKTRKKNNMPPLSAHKIHTLLYMTKLQQFFLKTTFRYLTVYNDQHLYELKAKRHPRKHQKNCITIQTLKSYCINVTYDNAPIRQNNTTMFPKRVQPQMKN